MVDPTDSLLHIGKTTLGRSNMGRSVRQQDYFRSFDRALDIAVSENADAVLQTGKLFQSKNPSPDVVRDLRTSLQSLSTADIPFYVVYSSKEHEAHDRFLSDLERQNLLQPLEGLQRVTESLFILGIPSDTEFDEVYSGVRVPDDATFFVALSDADPDRDYSRLSGIKEGLEKEPDAFLTGGATDPRKASIGGMRVIDPGAVEHVFGTSTFSDPPSTKGVNEYSVGSDRFASTRYTLESRAYETIEFTIDGDTTAESLRSELPATDLKDKAVLARVCGSDSRQLESAEDTVKQLLSERAFCVRVYDERTSGESGDQSRSTQVTSGPSSEELSTELEDIQSLVEDAKQAIDDDRTELAESELVDSYAVFSALKSRAENLRTETRDQLLETVSSNTALSGTFGTVRTVEQVIPQLKDEAEVVTALSDHGVDLDRAFSVQLDREALEEIAADDSNPVDEEDLFETESRRYVRRQSFDSDTPEDTDSDASHDKGNTERERDSTHKVYLGAGAPLRGWIPVAAEIVESEIVPLVTENSHDEDRDDTISVNFEDTVSISGWSYVDEEVVLSRIVPLVEEHRTD